jgi:hypothetical protein
MRVKHEKATPQIPFTDGKIPGAKPAISKSQTGAPSKLSASAEVVSYSMGTSTPAIFTDRAESGV